MLFFFFFQAEDGIRDLTVTGVQTCALPILSIASVTYGALLGGFFLGMLWRRAIQRDAILGMAVGIVAMSFVVFAKNILSMLTGIPDLLPAGRTPSSTVIDALMALSHIAFPWYVLIGTSVTIGVGILSSFTHRPAAAGDRWNE